MMALKAVLLEGLEVVFIVIAVGAGNGLFVPASIGAIVACVLVFIIGVFIRRPLARVPENTLKFAVGVMLSAFGVFERMQWLGVASHPPHGLDQAGNPKRTLSSDPESPVQAFVNRWAASSY